jgi:hypothetical protein
MFGNEVCDPKKVFGPFVQIGMVGLKSPKRVSELKAEELTVQLGNIFFIGFAQAFRRIERSITTSAHGVLAFNGKKPLSVTGTAPAGEIIFVEPGKTAPRELTNYLVIFNSVVDRVVDIGEKIRWQLRNFSCRFTGELKFDLHKKIYFFKAVLTGTTRYQPAPTSEGYLTLFDVFAQKSVMKVRFGVTIDRVFTASGIAEAIQF